jgi:lambda family phage tail tape measure protein/TP901 family phage tail tape measure protein
MSDQPIQLSMQASLEGMSGVLSSLNELKSKIGDLAEMDVTGKLKTQVSSIQTSMASLVTESANMSAAMAKALADGVKTSSEQAYQTVREYRQKIQTEYEKLTATRTLSVEMIASYKEQGASLYPSDSSRLREAEDLRRVMKEAQDLQVSDAAKNEAEITKIREAGLLDRMKRGNALDAETMAEQVKNLAELDRLHGAYMLDRFKRGNDLDAATFAEQVRLGAERDKLEGMYLLDRFKRGNELDEALAAEQRSRDAATEKLREASLLDRFKRGNELDEAMATEQRARDATTQKMREASLLDLFKRGNELDAARFAEQQRLQEKQLASSAYAQMRVAMAKPEGTYSTVSSMATNFVRNSDLDMTMPSKALFEEAEAAKAAALAHDKLQEKIKAGVGPTAALTAEKAKLTSEMKDMHSAARGLASGFGAMWMTWGSILPLMAGAGVSAAMVQMAKAGMDVQQNLTAMRVLGGESATAIGALNTQMLELAKTGPYGPMEISAAMKTLVLAGLDAKEVSVSLKDVMNFSVAGDTNIQQAADTLTTVAKAFKVGADGYGYVGDVISKAAAESKSSVEDMSNSFKTASAINQQYGVTLEDTAVGLALMANAGIRGTAAGTSLRNMVADLSGRTKKASDALKELWVEGIDQATGKVKNLDVVMQSLMTNLHDKTSASGALKFMQTIFDERGAKEAYAMFDALQKRVKETGEEIPTIFAELKDKVMNSAGFAAIAAAEMSLTPLNEVKSVAATLQTTLVETFDSMQPYLMETAVHLKEIFSSDGFKSAVRDLVELVGTLVTFALDHAKAISLLVLGYMEFRAVVTIMAELKAAQMALAAANAAMAVTAEAAGVAVTELGLASKLAVMGNPLLLALTALVTGAALAWGAYEIMVGKADKTHKDAAANQNELIGNLMKEADRLHEINEAKAMGISLDELKAQKAGKLADGDSDAAIAAARTRLANAKLVNVSGVADAQSNLDNLLQGEAQRKQALALAKYMVSSEAKIAADRTRKELADNMAANGALFTGSKSGPAGAAGSSHAVNDNGPAQIMKQYDTEMSLIKALEGDKLKLLNAQRSANLLSQEGFYAQEISLAASSEAAELGLIKASETAYNAAYEKKVRAILADPKDKEKASKLQAAANENASANAKFVADEEKLRAAANTRQVLQEIALQGQLRKIKTDARDFDRNEALNDAKKERGFATTDKLRYATADQSTVISAQATEQERLTGEVEKYDAKIQALNDSLRDDIELIMSKGDLTSEDIDNMHKEAEAVQKKTTELAKFRDLLKGTIPGKVDKAGSDAATQLAKDRKAEADWTVGARRALEEYGRSANNVAKSMGDVFTKAFKGMEDALVKFVKTGELDFDSLANSIIDDLVRIAVQQNITGPLAQGLSGFMSGLFSGGGSSNGAAGYSSEAFQFAAGSVTPSANGNVFASPGLSAYSGQIVSSPTMFAFAKGAGLMGEAGPEAIMPLTRGANGKLGVQSSGGGGVVVNIIESSDKAGKVERRSDNGVDMLDVFVEKVKSSIAGDITKGSGAVPNALASTYGINRVAGSY